MSQNYKEGVAEVTAGPRGEAVEKEETPMVTSRPWVGCLLGHALSRSEPLTG